MTEAIIDLDALVRMFGDEFEFALDEGRRNVLVSLRGQQIIRMPLPTTGGPWAGSSITVTLGSTRTWEFRVARWSITLKEEAAA